MRDPWQSHSDPDDYDDGYFEEDMPRVLRCNRCGGEEVRWRQQGGKWVLFSLKPGVVHQCPIPDPFDVVPG